MENVTYDSMAYRVRTVFGDWMAAVRHLKSLGWRVEDWENWLNEAQLGHYGSATFGLVQEFAIAADDLGIRKELRGRDDDVASCLACLWLWVGMDDLLPEASERRNFPAICEVWGHEDLV